MSKDNILRNTLISLIDPRRNMRSISPTWLASEAMNQLDPTKISLPAIALGCHMQLRQIARDILSEKYWEASEPTEQNSLWPDLQTRYPKAHSKQSDPEYILLEFCTDEDLEWNIGRLESEARAKQKHADALRAYKQSRDSSASA